MQKKINSSAAQKKVQELTRQAKLAMAIWIAYCVLMVTALLALLGWPAWQLLSRGALSMSGIICLCAALFLAFSLRPRSWTKPRLPRVFSPAFGVKLNQKNTPFVFTLVTRVAHELDIHVPLKITLTSDPSVTVFPYHNRFGKLESAYIAIGMPLLGCLSEAELGSCLTHQFSYLLKGAVPATARLLRLRRFALTAITELENSLFVLNFLYVAVARWFLRATANIAYVEVLEADLLAADRFGVVATRAAIEKIALIAPMWHAYYQHEIKAGLRRGAQLPIFEGFRLFCKPTTKRPAVQATIQAYANPPSVEFHNTPDVAERVNKLTPGAKPAYPPLHHCFHLLGGEHATEALWYAGLHAQAELTQSAEDGADANASKIMNTVSWQDYSEKIMPMRLREQFAESWMNPKKLPLAELVALTYDLEDGWEKMRAANSDFLSPQGKRNYCIQVLEEWVTACLLQRGFSLQYSPGQAWAMQRGETTVMPSVLMNAALSGKLKSAILKLYDPAPAAAYVAPSITPQSTTNEPTSSTASAAAQSESSAQTSSISQTEAEGVAGAVAGAVVGAVAGASKV
ncbi:MAG: hypothetical protein K2Y28_09980 [Burkholderiaceae bacterium]|nr:hypothetical protein [Burkholderiaceae bacterium]